MLHFVYYQNEVRLNVTLLGNNLSFICCHSNDFGIYINHGGFFHTLDGSTHYIGGTLVPRFDLDTDRYGYLDIEEEVQKLGYVSWKSISYMVPHSNVYVELKNDQDFMISLRHKVYQIYVDAWELKGDDEANLVDDVDDRAGLEDDGVSFEEDDRVRFEEEWAWDGNLEENVEEHEEDTSGEDTDYMHNYAEDYTDDEMEDDELSSDEEYTEARKALRDKTDKGLCGEFFNRVGHECGYSDYEDSDGDVYSSETDDDGETSRIRRRISRVVYDPNIDHKHLKLVIGMRFEDGLEARSTIKQNVIEDGRGIRFRRVTRTQMEAYCNHPCKWRVYGSLDKPTGQFLIKRLTQPHTCITAMTNKQVTSSWIANEYLEVFRFKLDITVREVRQDILRRFSCQVRRWKLYKAKDKAIEMLRGTVNEHYGKLRSYILELQRVDREGTFQLHLDWGAIFEGIYDGFSGLTKWFLEGCRIIIGVDGAFFKTYLGGFVMCSWG